MPTMNTRRFREVQAKGIRRQKLIDIINKLLLTTLSLKFYWEIIDPIYALILEAAITTFLD